MNSEGPRTGINAASIVIDNYNYAHFLADAIDSALEQTYPHTEVIVVDDGSTDSSREIIASYGARVRPVLKTNGGQASALNAGFAASRGDVVFFLDSDDILSAEAVANVMPHFLEPSVSKVHWPMWVFRSDGSQTGETRPPQAPPSGEFRQQVLERGPSNVVSSPTSGNAWSRQFLNRVMPIPEDLIYYRSCADEYLFTLAPVFGTVEAITAPQGCYREHGSSVYSSRSFAAQLKMELDGYADQCKALGATLARSGIEVDTRTWRQHSWFHRLDQAIGQIEETIPAGARVVLIDGGTWAPDWHSGRYVACLFNDREGVDWGPPQNDRVALDCLRSIMTQGVEYLVLAWPMFWWLKEYPTLLKGLNQQASLVAADATVRIYRLRRRSNGATDSLTLKAPAMNSGDKDV